MPKSRSMESLMNTSGLALKYLPSIEEVRISPVVSRRGYLNFLEEKGMGWTKKFVVSVHHQCISTSIQSHSSFD
jgi:hypothetical protein